MADKNSGRPWAPKQIIWSAITGAVLMAVVGFWGLDWVTNGGAKMMAKEAAKEAVLEHLVPICVEQAKTSPTADADIAALRKESSWSRSKFVEKKGWATMPGSSSPVSAITSPCAEAILSG